MSRRACLLFGLVLFAGCGPLPSRELIPYRYRQSLIEGGVDLPGDRSLSAKKVEPRQRKHPSDGKRLARCRALAGRSFPGPQDQAVIALLRACLGDDLPAGAARAESLALDVGPPRLLHLVFFRGTQAGGSGPALSGTDEAPITAVGIVVGLTGDRVQFLHLRREQARISVLNQRQPHRRRIGQEVENTYLRVIQPSDPPGTFYLAGQLLAGYSAWP